MVETKEMYIRKPIFKIAHISDAHLDFRQYGLGSRREDFRRAFDQCIKRCITEKVDVVLLCGDTFHNQKPDFISLVHFRDALRDLEEAKIDVVAITGNHDKEASTDFCSWIDLFDTVRALDPDWYVLVDSEDGNWGIQPILYTRDNKLIALYGVNWDRDVEQKVNEKILPFMSNVGASINILALHAGVSNVLPQDRGLLTEDFISKISKTSWKARKDVPNFDYIALGHIHKPYQRYDAYNPGSLENCSTEEWDYQDRGFFIVTFYDDLTKSVQKYYPQMRASKKVRIPVSMNSTQEHINAAASEKLRGLPKHSLIQVELFGSVGEQIPSLTLSNLKTHIYNEYNPLHIKVKDLSYVSKRKDSDVPVSTIVGDAFTEVFGSNKAIAEEVVELVIDGVEVNKIIEKVEEHLAANQEDTIN